jgi:hypothetical protein
VADAYLESRVRVELETLSFVIGLEEARELYEQLENILPREDVVRNNGGSFGFGHQNEEENNDE